MAETAMPWERQEHESQRAFEAFVHYRNMTPSTRSILAAWKAYKGPEAAHVEDTPGHFRRWASKNKWIDRAAAWDREKDRQARQAEIEAEKTAIAEMKKRHIGLSMALLNAAANALKKRSENPAAEDLSPYQIARFIREGARLEQVSRGVPSDIVAAGDDAVKQLADLLGVTPADLVGIRNPIKQESR